MPIGDRRSSCIRTVRVKQGQELLVESCGVEGVPCGRSSKGGQ